MLLRYYVFIALVSLFRIVARLRAGEPTKRLQIPLQGTKFYSSLKYPELT